MPDPPEPGGLRERKKAKTREAIVEIAIDLFTRKGFDATTVEEIAAAAEISPRTFFRYFPTKEDVVFLDQDLENAALAAALRHRKPDEDELDLLLRAATEVMAVTAVDGHRAAHLYELVRATPSLQARAYEVTMQGEKIIVDGMLGKRPSRAEVMRVRVLAAAAIAAVRAAMEIWMEAGARGDPADAIREAAAILRQGFVRHR